MSRVVPDRGGAAAHVVVDDLAVLDLAADDAHHLGAVLRLRPGSVVSATDGLGGYVECRYGGGSALEACSSVARVARREPAITVAFAPVKGDRPEWAVQKLTELGVDRILLLETARGVVRWDHVRIASHLDRLRKVARQAVMQSRQCWMPSVEGMVSFAALVSGSHPVALCEHGGAHPSLDRPSVLIGPEGGWAPEELEAAGSAGASFMGLGPAVLRAETAAVAAGNLLCALRSGMVLPAPAFSSSRESLGGADRRPASSSIPPVGPGPKG